MVISGSLWLPLRFDTLDGGLDTLGGATCKVRIISIEDQDSGVSSACHFIIIIIILYYYTVCQNGIEGDN